MRVFASIAAVFVILSQPASAQSWMEYDYPEAGFSIHFPAAPKLASGLYETGAGAFVNAQIYSAYGPGNRFIVTVSNLSGTGVDQETALTQAVEAARSHGDVKVDIPARVNGQRGRQLSIVGKDGGHSNLAIFFANNHLFQIEGTVLASNPDPQSGDAIRFQQSLRFTGDYAGRRFAQAPGANGGGRGRFNGRGGGRFGRRGNVPMPAAMPPPPDQVPQTP
ncbi:MAG TPA: hypothetical protein VGM72_07420 [Micropepsaceae bacterium]|jgi:hypothetical protein